VVRYILVWGEDYRRELGERKTSGKKWRGLRKGEGALGRKYTLGKRLGQQ